MLLREIQRFRQEHGLADWPCIIAGGNRYFSRILGFLLNDCSDFNFPPTDPGYALLMGETLSLEQWKKIDESRVIHVSVDSTLADSSTPTPVDENIDPDVEITDSRTAQADDRLLSNEEIFASFRRLSPLRSAYEEAQRMVMEQSSPIVFGSRLRESFLSQRLGYYEPVWTSYTHFWKSTLGKDMSYLYITIFF